MKLNIGQNIRQLRRERDITQRKFAGILAVTYQSVSRCGETARAYPDMSLPTVAEFFGTTVDKLLGVDETVERTRVAEYCVKFQEAISRGDVDKCIETAREGVREYPNNYVLLNKLMYALFISGDDDGNIPQWKENMQKYDAEITALGERIMKYCPDQDIRLEATSRLAFNHCEMGRKETGRAIYDTLPSAEYSRENQMWWSLEDDEKLPFLRKKVNEDYGSLRGSICFWPTPLYLSVQQSIAAVKKGIRAEKLSIDVEKTPDGLGAAKIYS